MRVLVLTGGGSKGAWQIGAVKRLWDEGARWDHIVGTSVGAVNALGITTSGVIQTLSLWRELDGRGSLMSWNWSWPWNWDAIFRFTPLEKLLSARTSWPPGMGVAHVCTVDALDLQIRYFRSDEFSSAKDFIKYVVGSCVVAGIQKAPEGRWIDGGHREFAPVSYAKELGATHIDVVSTSSFDETPGNPWQPSGWFPIVKWAGRALTALTHEVWLRDLAISHLGDTTLHIYAPEKELEVDTLQYEKKVLGSLIEQGYRDSSPKLIIGGGQSFPQN